MALELSHVGVRYGSLVIVEDVSFQLAPGHWLMLVGPNGAGKSTLVSAISQGLAYSGSIHLDGRDLARIAARTRARRLGVLLQNHHVHYGFSVDEVVRLGRYAHASGWYGGGDTDEEVMVQAALQKTSLTDKRDQSVLTLSGGELQRTFVAQLLAQDPDYLILDEPTNHLDLLFQKKILSLFTDWLQERRGAILSVMHDLSLARLYGTDALLLDQGRLVALGPVDEVLSPANLEAVYGLDVWAEMERRSQPWRQRPADSTAK